MNKTVVITGASRGIGKAIALKYAKAGNYNIVITCHNNSAMINEVKEAIQSYGCNCITYTGSLSDSSNVKELHSLALSAFGNIDILINNAGVSYIGLLTDMSDDDWNTVLGTNLNSVFYCCREFARTMLHNHSGSIINISSVWGNSGASCEVAYSASKGAINSFTKALAKELAPSGISVNAVACGLIDTDMNRCFDESELNSLYEEIPCGRAGKPSEVAELVFSVSEQTNYMTGQIITIDGGWT